MSALRHAFAVALGLMLGTTSLFAQARSGAQGRDGLFLGLGFGGAIYTLDCTGCVRTGANPDPWDGGHGSGGYVRIGQSVAPRFSLGIEFGGQGVPGEDERDSNIFHLLLTGQYHPRQLGGFHLTGGMGPASTMLGMRRGAVEAMGVLVRAGGGYSFGIGRRFALTPYASIGHLEILPGTIKAFGSAGSPPRIEARSLVQYGLGLDWYPDRF